MKFPEEGKYFQCLIIGTSGLVQQLLLTDADLSEVLNLVLEDLPYVTIVVGQTATLDILLSQIRVHDMRIRLVNG
jgi:hypothetical protein